MEVDDRSDRNSNLSLNNRPISASTENGAQLTVIRIAVMYLFAISCCRGDKLEDFPSRSKLEGHIGSV
jgi:hypothetical protein